jgi:aminocarboxymuconate-semialdehyde decarboxylase
MFSREWMDLLRAHGEPLYNVQPVANGRECIFRGDVPVTVPTAGHFDYELRIREMDAAGVDMAVVSLTCPNVYWGGREISLRAASIVKRRDVDQARVRRVQAPGFGSTARGEEWTRRR